MAVPGVAGSVGDGVESGRVPRPTGRPVAASAGGRGGVRPTPGRSADEPAPDSDPPPADAPVSRLGPVWTAPGAPADDPPAGPGVRCEAASAAPEFDLPSPGAAPDEPAPGLYLHIPFCRRICPYCDFAVTPFGGPAAERRFEAYRKALLAELRLRAEAPPFGPNAERPTPPADTVYFGGGTPSLAPPGFFAEILGTAADLGLTTTSPWAALEANPEDLAPEVAAGSPRPAGRAGSAGGLSGEDRAAGDRARQWAAEGITGVSLGAQSLRESRLRFLGRAHSPAGVRRAVSRLAEAGLDWVSLDLIYGAAPDRPEEIRDEFAEAASLPGLTHLSAYELTVEPATAFGRRAVAGERLTGPDGEGGGLFRLVHRTLAEAGFPAYEASNFARSDADRSRHNPKYWRGAPYLGCGPSAHSFVPGVPGVPGRRATPPGADGSAAPARRFWNRRALRDWQEAVAAGRLPTGGSEAVPPAGLALEELFLRLRTTDGLDLAGFAARHGTAVVEANRARFRNWRERGLVSFHEDSEGAILRPTLDGLAVAEALAAEVDLAPLTAMPPAAPAARPLTAAPPPAPAPTPPAATLFPSTGPAAPAPTGPAAPAFPPTAPLSAAPAPATSAPAAPRPAASPSSLPSVAVPPAGSRPTAPPSRPTAPPSRPTAPPSIASPSSASPSPALRPQVSPPSPTPPPKSPDLHAPSAPAAAPGIPA